MGEFLKVLHAILIMTLMVIVPIFGAFWDIAKYGWRLFGGRKGLTTHGDADWATDKELRQAGNFDPRGFLMAFTDSGKPVFSNPQRSVMVLAGPGQGKSQTALGTFRAKKLLDISQRQHLIIHDPAGELYDAGAPILKDLGYTVEKLDMIEPGNGIRYDVLSYLKPQSPNFDSDLKGLCELLIPPEPGSRQPHFVDYARSMLHDVITLNMVYEGNTRSLADCVDEILVDAKRKKMITRMEKYDHDFKAIDIFGKMSANESASMLSTSLRKLSIWALNSVREISTVVPGEDHPRGWTFEEMMDHDKPSALFIRTGLRPGGGEFARVLFGNAINTVRRRWDATGKANPRGLQVFIDEAARLENCAALMDGHNELRKAKLTIWLGFLSFAAIKEHYGSEATTLFNGCDHIVFPGNKDMETNELYSRMIGDMTIESGSRSENNMGESKGLNEQARRRIKPDEIRRAAYDRCFAILDSQTLKGKKVFYIKGGKLYFR